jgi:hypothetical protein
MEQIMEMIPYVRKGNIMNIKENHYTCIYQFKHLNELTEEQRAIKDNDSQNSTFDIVVRHEYEYTPTRSWQGTSV